jgi:4-amino-4-deoxy-L-arabinose transferase-like glycosyltransferase
VTTLEGVGRAPRWARLSLLAAIAAFLGVSVVWLAADSRILDWDSGRHVFNTWAMREALAGGDLAAPVTLDNINHYPPLLYLVGAAGLTVAGDWQNLDAAMLAMNVVFVPLLALGCWGTARLAYGELAGVLAVVFALGAPMVISAFHLYMLDVPQASMVAVTVWLLLASRRLQRTKVAALAGLAAAGAMLLKPTTVLFLAGPLLVILIRGGWRRPMGILAFAAVPVVLAGPWYIEQFDNLFGLTKGASTTEGTAAAGSSYVTPHRFTVANVLWYAWNLLNLQLLAPLFAFFAVGLGVAVVRFARTAAADDLTPELVFGGLASYAGVTFITLKDYRYSLPVLVFVAALAVAWVPALRGTRLRVAAGVLVAVAVANVAAVSTHTGPRITLSLVGDRDPTLLGERTLRIFSPDGYIANKPRDDSGVLDVMRGLREEGFRKLQYTTTGDLHFTDTGVAVVETMAGLELPPSWNPADMAPDVPLLLRRAVEPGDPPPCALIEDGWGIYVAHQRDTTVPFEDYNLICPERVASARR